MKKILSIGLIAAFLILLGSIDASAQRRKSKDPQPTEQKEPTEEDSNQVRRLKKRQRKKRTIISMKKAVSSTVYGTEEVSI